MVSLRAGVRSRRRTDQVDRPFDLNVHFRSERASYERKLIVRAELRMKRTVRSNERSQKPWFRGISVFRVPQVAGRVKHLLKMFRAGFQASIGGKGYILDFNGSIG